jgi:hypothetical protein
VFLGILYGAKERAECFRARATGYEAELGLRMKAGLFESVVRRVLSALVKILSGTSRSEIGLLFSSEKEPFLGMG